MKKKGTLEQHIKIVKPIKVNDEYTSKEFSFVDFEYAKVDKDLYLIFIPKIFKRGKNCFAFINEKKFKKLIL